MSYEDMRSEERIDLSYFAHGSNRRQDCSVAITGDIVFDEVVEEIITFLVMTFQWDRDSVKQKLVEYAERLDA